jgi:hypothetical protein
MISLRSASFCSLLKSLILSVIFCEATDKSLACLLDQVVNNYLSKLKLDAGSNVSNNTNKVVESGKTYTTMEHAWDEAYGYIYGNDNLSRFSSRTKPNNPKARTGL